MNEITEKLLAEVSDYKGEFKGAYNIREDSGCVARQSSKHIKITAKKISPVLISTSAARMNRKPYTFRPASHTAASMMLYTMTSS